MSEVTVDPDDIRVVAGVFDAAGQAYGSALVLIPGFGDAMEAVGRLAAAAMASTLPPDPVSGTTQMAITHRAMLDAYEAQGFDHHEAFQMLLTIVQAGALRCAHG